MLDSVYLELSKGDRVAEAYEEPPAWYEWSKGGSETPWVPGQKLAGIWEGDSQQRKALVPGLLQTAHLVGIEINDGSSGNAFHTFKQELTGREDV